jgi:hypothetical protein
MHIDPILNRMARMYRMAGSPAVCIAAGESESIAILPGWRWDYLSIILDDTLNVGGLRIFLLTVHISATFFTAFLYLAGNSGGSRILIVTASTRWFFSSLLISRVNLILDVSICLCSQK